MSYTVEQYREAAERLWGEAGAFTVDRFVELNELFFDGALPPLPVVIGITAYGHCIGLTRRKALPRITIASPAFKEGGRYVQDIVLHEMIHAELLLHGKTPDHNAPPWCARIMELSPAVLGQTIKAKPSKLKRSGKTVMRMVEEGHLSQGDLARWPHSLRPADYYSDSAIPVDSY